MSPFLRDTESDSPLKCSVWHVLTGSHSFICHLTHLSTREISHPARISRLATFKRTVKRTDLTAFLLCNCTWCVLNIDEVIAMSFFLFMPSVLWRCWLGVRKGIRPVKTWVVGCWHGYQLMPLPLTVSCFSKIQIGRPIAFLVPAHPGSPGKKAVKRVCVCSFYCFYVFISYILVMLAQFYAILLFLWIMETFQCKNSCHGAPALWAK